MKKKILCLLLCAAVICGYASAFSAEDKTILELKTSTGSIGSIVNIGLNITENSQTGNGKFIIKYDKTLLEYTGYTVGPVLQNAAVSVYANKNGEIVITYDRAQAISDGGVMLNLSMKILSDKYSAIPLTLSVDHFVKVPEEQSIQIEYELKQGTITVEQQAQKLKGDVNDDGVVDEQDKTLLISYIIKNNSSASSADINKDGHVDITDLSQLIILIG